MNTRTYATGTQAQGGLPGPDPITHRRFSTKISTETILGTRITKMRVATIIDDVVWRRLATIAKSKDGRFLTTNFDETCYQDIRYSKFENDAPTNGGEGVWQYLATVAKDE